MAITEGETLVKDLSPDEEQAILGEVYKYLMAINRPKADRLTIDKPLDDVVQEGMIHAWEDIRAGKYTKSHIFHRASVWAFSFSSTRRPPTGKPAISRDFMVNKYARASFEKVKNYRDEYFELHGKWPTAVHMSQVLGLSVSWVNKTVTQVKAGARPDPEKYRNEHGDLDYTSAVAFSIEAAQDRFVGESDTSAGNVKELPFLLPYASESAEKQYLANEAGLDLLKHLKKDNQKRAVYMRYWEDMTQEQIGRALGAANPQVAASRTLEYAMIRLRKVLT